MKRKVFMVGLLVPDNLPDSVVQNYVTRAMKHFHNDTDHQSTFHGTLTPKGVMVFDMESTDRINTAEDVHNFFNVLDRMQGKR